MNGPPIAVLLLEDSPTAAEIVQQALAQATTCRFRVEHVHTLAEGMASLGRGGADVILTDLTLPDSHGLQAVTQLRARAPHLPIVVLTGTYEDERLALEALQKGAQDYVFKEGMIGAWLIRVLRYAIERKQLEEAMQGKLQETEILNRVMMDREERILELKREVNALLQEFGRPSKYQS